MWRWLSLLLMTMLGWSSAAEAGAPCRPMRTLHAGEVLQLDPLQTTLSPRLEAVIDADLVLNDDATMLGLGAGVASIKLEHAITVQPQTLQRVSLAQGRASLRFDAGAQGHATALREGRRYLITVDDKGQALNGNGKTLEVRPLLMQPQAFTLIGGTRLTLDATGHAVVSKGSTLRWQLGDNPDFEFALVNPSPLEETVPPTAADADVTIIQPSRLLPGSMMKVQVRASGFDFRTLPLSFCFSAGAESQPGLSTLSAPGKLVSESSDGALFEVRLPAEMAQAVPLQLPGRAATPLGALDSWFGKPARVRVMGLNGDKVVFDAGQVFVTSNYRIALVSGFILIAALIVLSGLLFKEPNPMRLMGRFARHRTQRFSLSNVQIMMWTLLVLYAFCFVWVANGILLDISSGVLVLLGISGGTSVLSRGIDQMASAGEAPPPIVDTASLKDLVINDNGEFDLLRFQMLGFTLFTLAYSFVSVIRSEGLPQIPDNLYMLMGISSGAYVGGKVADNMKPKAPETGTAPSGFEKRLTVDDIRPLQKALKAPETGSLDEATRAAIAQYKVEEGIVPADGSVNDLLLARLKDAGAAS